MKSVLANSLLVSALALFLGLPLMGFSFLSLNQDENPNLIIQPQVLGTNTNPSASNNSKLEVIDQVEYTINLSAETDSNQVLYNVIPDYYATDKYRFLLVVPNEVKSAGIVVELEDSNEEYNKNLIVNSYGDPDNTEVFNVSVLILDR